MNSIIWLPILAILVVFFGREIYLCVRDCRGVFNLIEVVNQLGTFDDRTAYATQLTQEHFWPRRTNLSQNMIITFRKVFQRMNHTILTPKTQDKKHSGHFGCAQWVGKISIFGTDCSRQSNQLVTFNDKCICNSMNARTFWPMRTNPTQNIIMAFRKVFQRMNCINWPPNWWFGAIEIKSIYVWHLKAWEEQNYFRKF